MKDVIYKKYTRKNRNVIIETIKKTIDIKNIVDFKHNLLDDSISLKYYDSSLTLQEIKIELNNYIIAIYNNEIFCTTEEELKEYKKLVSRIDKYRDKYRDRKYVGGYVKEENIKEIIKDYDFNDLYIGDKK